MRGDEFSTEQMRQEQRNRAQGVEMSEVERPSVEVRVLFFGAAREALGRDEARVRLPRETSGREALDLIRREFPSLARFAHSLLLAVNQQYVPLDQAIEVCEGDEVAVFPPVSGGSSSPDGDLFAIVTEPIDVGEVARQVVPRTCGATVTFDGYVREWTGNRRTLYLIYEAYEPMALREMARIGREAHARFAIERIAIVHRVGRLNIGETSVCIAVCAPHRRDAFAACEWAIAELKRTVPIWKKEVFEDGEVWVEGERSSPVQGEGEAI
jgi:molybdopterin synthase catalytic subunit